MFKTFLDILLKPKEFSYIQDRLYFSHFEEGFLSSIYKNYIAIFEIEGIDYSTKNNQETQQIHNKIFNFINQTNNDITISTHIIRRKQARANIKSINDNVENIIDNKCKDRFSSIYNNKYYLLISTYTSNKFTNKRNLETIKLYTEKVLNFFKAFNVSFLNEENTLKFYYELANYKSIARANISKNENINEFIGNSAISFQDGFIKYENSDVMYSKIFSIYLYENDTDKNDFILSLLRQKIDFSLYQIFCKVDDNKAKTILKKKKILIADTEKVDISSDEFEAVQEAIINKQNSLFEYSFFVQIFHKDKDILKEQVIHLSNLIEQYSYKTKAENYNLQNLYFSNFLELENFNQRKRYRICSNISVLNMFNSTLQGFNKCSFGNSERSIFLNDSGGIYNFVFHKDASKNALGNTIIVGGSGQGKTTLISFLISQCKAKYPHFLALLLDRFKGMEVFTRLHNGSYNDFEKNIEINPLSLKDTSDNRAFLLSFFKSMFKKDNQEAIQIIQNAINQIFTSLALNERNLYNAYSAFGIESENNNMPNIIKDYAYGERSRYFSSKDGINLASSIIGCNMDVLFKDNDALVLIAQALFHKLYELQAQKNNPFLIFIDEALAYFQNDYFAKTLLQITTEIRKKNGLIVFAVQDIKFFNKNKYSKDILGSSIATYILFPDPQVDEEYKHTFNLSDNEFDFIKQASKNYQVLVKKQGSQSVILDVDLSFLDEYLNVFDSSSDSVKRLNEIQKKYPQDYADKYLNKKLDIT